MAVVLITRPEPGATQTALRVAALGFVPLIAPVLCIRPLGRVAHLSPRVTATLLTSRNAVAGCPPSSHRLPVFAVGDATARSATDAGFERVSTASGNAADLARLVAGTLDPNDGSLFLPVGRRQGMELASELRQKGFRVVRHVVYQASAAPALPIACETHLLHRQVGAALFFSAETARNFVRLVRQAKLDRTLENVEAVSISDQPAAELKALPWRRLSVAAKPNQDEMLALLK